MNTIYYANLNTGERAAVRIRKQKAKSMHILKVKYRYPNMRQADDAMLARGFQRWPRNKPMPALKITGAK